MNESLPPKHELIQSVTFCRLLRDFLEPHNYCCGLTGSVLFNGASDKDVDIIVYPLKTELDHPTHEGMMGIIANSLFPGVAKFINSADYHPDDSKVVYSVYDGTKRYDFFFLK